MPVGEYHGYQPSHIGNGVWTSSGPIATVGARSWSASSPEPKYYICDGQGQREVTEQEFRERFPAKPDVPAQWNPDPFGTFNRTGNGDIQVLKDEPIRIIPRDIALGFWRNHLKFEDGLIAVLKREQTPDVEIGKRLDLEYEKACAALAELARRATTEHEPNSGG